MLENSQKDNDREGKKMRTFTYTSGNKKRVSYSEKELKSREYSFPIADGEGFYRVHKIHLRGNDPIVELRKIENHPHNLDNYGEPEKLVRVSELVRQVEYNKLWERIEKEQEDKAKSLVIGGKYFLSSFLDKSGDWVKVLLVKGNMVKIKIIEPINKTSSFYSTGIIHQVNVSNLYKTREEAARK